MFLVRIFFHFLLQQTLTLFPYTLLPSRSKATASGRIQLQRRTCMIGYIMQVGECGPIGFFWRLRGETTLASSVLRDTFGHQSHPLFAHLLPVHKLSPSLDFLPSSRRAAPFLLSIKVHKVPAHPFPLGHLEQYYASVDFLICCKCNPFEPLRISSYGY